MPVRWRKDMRPTLTDAEILERAIDAGYKAGTLEACAFIGRARRRLAQLDSEWQRLAEALRAQPAQATAPDLPDSDPLSWRSWKTLGPPDETYVVWRARMEKEAAYDARKNDPRYVTVSAPAQPAPESQAAQDVFEAVALEWFDKPGDVFAAARESSQRRQYLAAFLRERFGGVVEALELIQIQTIDKGIEAQASAALARLSPAARGEKT